MAAKAPIDMAPSDALSIQKQATGMLKGRKVAILFAEGSDKNAIDTLKGDIEKAGGTAFLVAPKVGEIKAKGGTLKADGQLAGSPSVLFDAVASVLTADAAAKLAKDGAAVQWFMDAFRSEEHTSELQSLMRISYAVFCLKKKKQKKTK